MHDRVDYELPFGPLGFLATPLISLQLRAIFGYRRAVVEPQKASTRSSSRATE